MDMEAVEIKTEPLDEYFNQIFQEEVIIKSENEVDYPSSVGINAREPEVQIREELLEPKEEPPDEPEESSSPDRSLKEDRLREEINPELDSNHCKYCNMFSKSRTSLKLHERNCQYKNDCRLCGQKFVTSYALSTHMNKAHNQCVENLSPQKETIRSNLGRPPNENSGCSDNRCDICNLKFANSRDLNNHKKKHNTCQQCGENFKLYEYLKQHTCENVAIKEEAEDQSETESPTKKIFRATNSMVVIPGQEVHTPVKSNAIAKNAKPKKRKSRVLFQQNFNESSSDNENGKISIDNFTPNSSPKKGFSVVTRDTDFEAFAQQMMKGFTDISEPLVKPRKNESISDRILRKLHISTDGESKDECEQRKLVAESDLITKGVNLLVSFRVDEQHQNFCPTETNQSGRLVPQRARQIKSNKFDEADSLTAELVIALDNALQAHDVIVDSEGNVYKILKENFVNQSAQIKEEPLDEAEQDEEPVIPKMPSPLPFIKDETSDQPETTDSTDLLLEELFDRKAKKIAKVLQTKFPFNPSFEPNGLGFKVKKEITVQKSFDFESKISKSNFSPPKKKKRTSNLKKKPSVRNVVIKKKPLSLAISHVSRKKALPHQVKEEILENITPVPENNSRKMTKKQLLTKPSLKLLPTKPLPTVKLPKSLKSLPPDNKISEMNKDSIAERIFFTADLIVPAGDETSYTADSHVDQKPIDDIALAAVEIACTKDLVHFKTENMSCEENDRNSTTACTSASALTSDNKTSKADDSSQQSTNWSEIPSNCDFDFEEVIQSNKLPNFKNVNNVIRNLTEEYKKAEKVKLEEEAPISEIFSQLQKLPPEGNEAQHTPGSLFFPILDDTQVYNMVASSLNEKYNYVWICPICPRQYCQIRPFKKHLLAIHFRFKSDLEGQTFELRPVLVSEAGPDETFCHLCHVTLADNASLRKHQLEMHKEQDLTIKEKKKPLLHRCYICSKLCSSRTLLAEHMKSDCGKNPQHGCNVCEKKFHTKSTLNLHKTMHTGELPHSCTYCQKRFRTRGQLTVHTRTHTGEKPFPCKVCGQRFTHRETLIAHLSRHIDMKRYKCYGCDQFFSCISGLKTHRTTRPETCGRVELDARAVGPRVRVIKGNVIFEPQPIYNARLSKSQKPFQESYVLDHNYYKRDSNQTKKVSKQTVKSEPIIIMP